MGGKRLKKKVIKCLIGIILIIIGVSIVNTFFYQNGIKEISFTDFSNMLYEKEIAEVNINFSEAKFKFIDNNGITYKTDNPRNKDFKENLLKHNVKVVEVDSIPYVTMISLMISFALLVVISKQMDVFSKKNHKIALKPTENFSMVAGLTPIKKDLEFLVDFVSNTDKYVKMGAELPKGIILYGEPGTGKTLLAKAIAGEANIPFFSASGSEFIEMFVGRGAKRVRDLFETAKENSPCIVFIDEIDAIGKVRGSQSSTSEHEQTLNQLLTEMDGFNASNGILVIGATNRLEVLDKALLRPGRFDNHICIPLPSTPTERMEVIDLYKKDKIFAEDVDFTELSKQITGFSPSSIKSLLNEATIISIQLDKECIDKECIDKAMFKKLLKGHEKNGTERNQKDLKTIAWHEAGHSLVARLLDIEVPKVTVIQSTSGAGGVTFINEKRNLLHSKEDIENQIMITYAGRCAEELLFNDKNLVTTGASNDIQVATNLIIRMIEDFGMSEKFGMLSLKSFDVNTDDIIAESQKISNLLYERALGLLKENKESLVLIAEKLILQETISGKELDELIIEKTSN